MAPHSSTLAWKIPWMEEPGRLQSMGSLTVGHDWATSLWLFTFMHGRRKWQPTPVFLPGESHGRGAWWAAVYVVAQSQTRLKRLSSSSSPCYRSASVLSSSHFLICNPDHDPMKHYFPNLSAHWNSLGGIPNYWCLCPSTKGCDLIEEHNLGFGVFRRSPDGDEYGLKLIMVMVVQLYE